MININIFFVVVQFTIIKNTIDVCYWGIHSENVLHFGGSSFIHFTLGGSVFIVAMLQQDLCIIWVWNL